jgi:hypothetical protein
MLPRVFVFVWELSDIIRRCRILSVNFQTRIPEAPGRGPGTSGRAFKRNQT